MKQRCVVTGLEQANSRNHWQTVKFDVELEEVEKDEGTVSES